MYFWSERFTKKVFSTMWHILSFGYFYLLSNHAMVLGTVMLGHIIFGPFIVYNTSHFLLLPCDPNGSAAVKIRCRSIRYNLLDLGCFHFPIIFDLDCGQEVTPIFVSQGTIFLSIILQLVLHGWEESVINWNYNLINRKLFVADFPISCFITISLHQNGG